MSGEAEGERLFLVCEGEGPAGVIGCGEPVREGGRLDWWEGGGEEERGGIVDVVAGHGGEADAEAATEPDERVVGGEAELIERRPGERGEREGGEEVDPPDDANVREFGCVGLGEEGAGERREGAVGEGALAAGEDEGDVREEVVREWAIQPEAFQGPTGRAGGDDD